MKEVSKKDKLFFYERHFQTLDGLWMIETEREIGFEQALDIDLNVWVKLLEVILRRTKRYLILEENSIENFVKILSFRWTVEGWNFELREDGSIIVNKCPYEAAMQRNPNRHDKIEAICNDMCIPFYQKIATKFNPDIEIRRNKHKGLGDEYCDFQFYFQSKKFTPSEELITFSPSVEDKLFYFKRNFFTLNNLWIIEVENKTDWSTTLKIDIVVWQRLYKILFRRVRRYLEIEGNNLQDLIEILSFCWSCEGYKYEILKNDPNEAIIYIKECPYKPSMERNPDLYEKIEDICKKMCVPFLESALEKFNPNIKVERKKSLGTGDDYCGFYFTMA
jgi:predicted hydrocarbon binding protein